MTKRRNSKEEQTVVRAMCEVETGPKQTLTLSAREGLRFQCFHTQAMAPSARSVAPAHTSTSAHSPKSAVGICIPTISRGPRWSTVPSSENTTSSVRRTFPSNTVISSLCRPLAHDADEFHGHE